MRIVIITGKELRHSFFRLVLSSEFNIIKSFCEEKSLEEKVRGCSEDTTLRSLHLRKRSISEEDFFKAFVVMSKDMSNPKLIESGSVTLDELITLDPDLIVTYGCSIIKENIVDYFYGKILNIHLGLSPYYRGSGTNFWPFINGEFECVGATFLLMDKGIDTGPIVHQIRAKIYLGDTFHQIGNRLIRDMAFVCVDLIKQFYVLKSVKQQDAKGKIYKRKDFTEDSVKILNSNFNNNVIENYLIVSATQEKKFPIVESTVL